MSLSTFSFCMNDPCHYKTGQLNNAADLFYGFVTKLLFNCLSLYKILPIVYICFCVNSDEILLYHIYILVYESTYKNRVQLYRI